jgi:hypothetical protein
VPTYPIAQPADNAAAYTYTQPIRDSIIGVNDHQTRITTLESVGASSDGIYLDSFTGTDDARLTSAIAAQQATAGMPPIILGARNHSFNQVRTLYSGLKLIGANYSGPKNLELSSANFVTSRVTLGAAVSSGTSSWWNSPGSDCYDIFMADFAVSGSAGASTHQFLDFPNTSTMYSCEFRSLSFNFMRSILGRKDRVCGITQVVLSGHWTANNLWDTQFNIGGSDNSLWMGGYINMGPSSSVAQTGTYVDGDYEMLFSSVSNTNVGYIYMTALNGWRGIKITGSSGNGLFFHGGVYEGYKGNTTSLTAGPAPGSVIRIEGGSGAFYGPNVGQAMNDPDVAEGGYIHMTGGEWMISGATFYRGLLADTVPVIYQTGGRLLVQGATRRQNETWTTRPKYSTTATGPNSTQTSFYCPDQSLVP